MRSRIALYALLAALALTLVALSAGLAGCPSDWPIEDDDSAMDDDDTGDDDTADDDTADDDSAV